MAGKKMEDLVKQIIEDMDNGKPCPWEKPWFARGMINWKTGREYNGMNALSLSCSADKRELSFGQWATFKQISDSKGKVKKGEHGSPVFFWNFDKEKDNEGKTVEGGKTRAWVKTFIVFNIDQTEGLKPREVKSRELNKHETAEKILSLSGADIRYPGTCNQAAFLPTDDRIELPPRDSWKDDESFYSTAFHELIHWTSPKDRANRPHFYAGDGRAFEELVAEIGAAFLCSFLDMPYKNQHTSYIKSWVSMFNEKSDTLFRAAGKAQKAADYILCKAGLKEKAVYDKGEKEAAK
jgi:antirestriction protein ArdC